MLAVTSITETVQVEVPAVGMGAPKPRADEVSVVVMIHEAVILSPEAVGHWSFSYWCTPREWDVPRTHVPMAG